jgi:hypothetical protein
MKKLTHLRGLFSKNVLRMAKIDLQGTEFTVQLLPPKMFGGGWGKLRIAMKNEHLDYSDSGRRLLLSDVEEWIVSAHRLLAGAYSTPYSLSFEKAGFSVDLFPFEGANGEATREERRQNDCMMIVRLLMKSADKRSYLGGVYSIILHREEIRNFMGALRSEFEEIYAKLIHGMGKYSFVGVSPLGYEGCNYWYLDESKSVKKGDYVWVRMGRHNTEQIVLVDSVRCFSSENAPFEPSSVKRVLRSASAKEIEKFL